MSNHLDMWPHKCEDGAGMAIGKGEPCNWCDATEPIRQYAVREVAENYGAAPQPAESNRAACEVERNAEKCWRQPCADTGQCEAPAATVPAPSGETEAQRLELVAAWNDLPDALRAHPGLKRLYRALGGISRDGVETSDGGKR
jgi:hypothetical protein